MSRIQQACQRMQKGIDKAFNSVGDYLDKHPALYKVVLVAMHFFRAALNFALMIVSPLHVGATMAIMAGGTLVYRAAIERFCAFRFAIPAMVGAAAAWLAKLAIINFVSHAAMMSVGMIFLNALALLPLLGYIGWVIFLSHTDIEKHEAKLRSSHHGGHCCAT